MYDAVVLPALQAMNRAGHLLDVVDATGRANNLLSAKLAPDMFDFSMQIRMVPDFALRATFPLTGRAVPELGHGHDMAALRARLEESDALVRGLTEADFDGGADRIIRHRAGDAELEQTGRDYLQRFALPNLWFHLSMAFAILRIAHVPVGKGDFDGLHSYAPGFSFVS
ncbi:DUF1993 domain-containing protein [Pelagovum pacificum]|nr:DUF1993 domain-containing protein [Pelagovum pacificum]QQA43766.1 DUF1993 domain-containing protein [Pelagovum pacificum]